MTNSSPKPQSIQRAFVVLFLFAFFLQCFGSLHHKSPTFDEVLYIPAGYSFLQTGSVLSNPEAQLLPRALTAVALAGMRLNFDSHDVPAFKARFQWSADFLFHRNAKLTEEIVFRGRLPVIVLGLLLLVVMYWWSRQLFGPTAGLITLAFAALEPNLIAFSSLATPDLSVTAFYLFTVCSFWHWLQHQDSPASQLLTGCLLAATCLSKTTGLFLVPVLVLIWSGDRWRRHSEERQPAWRSFARLLLIFVVAFALINVVFLFEGTFSDKEEIIRLTLGNRDPGVLRWFVFFLPDHFAFPLLYNVAESFGTFHPFPFFLNGHYSTEGFWYYFFEAILIKTPLPSLLWFGFSALLLCRSATRGVSLILFVPWVFLLLYFSFLNKLDLGLRHVLPVYPFLCLIAGAPFAASVRISRRLLFGLAGVLLLWNLWSAVRIYPYHLAYFNEAVGGPENGYHFLVDSNLDWGQDLGNLKKFMDNHRIDRIFLSYFGTADPLHYRIRYDFLPSPVFEPWTIRHYSRNEIPFRPSKGIYAISATNLQGIYLSDRNTFAMFRDKKPEAFVGYSILIYSYP